MPKYENANSHWISTQVQGKSFVDVGCMWGVTGDYSFLAEDSGASKVVGIDIYPAQPEFHSKISRRKSAVRFVHGDINDQRTIDEALKVLGGRADLVFCSGVLYHVPDPIFTLRQLGKLLRPDGMLILNTMTIPEQETPCASILLSGLTPEQLAKVSFGRRGVGLSDEFDPKKGYANWVWGMSPSCVREMLKVSGFDVVDEDLGVHSEVYASLSKRNVASEFVDCSGDWSADKGAKVFLGDSLSVAIAPEAHER